MLTINFRIFISRRFHLTSFAENLEVFPQDYVAEFRITELLKIQLKLYWWHNLSYSQLNNTISAPSAWGRMRCCSYSSSVSVSMSWSPWIYNPSPLGLLAIISLPIHRKSRKYISLVTKYLKPAGFFKIQRIYGRSISKDEVTLSQSTHTAFFATVAIQLCRVIDEPQLNRQLRREALTWSSLEVNLLWIFH